MRAVIYTRVSSDEQIKGMSLEFQRADCLRYVAERGMEVADVFEERGESAKFADRPELLKLLDYCKRNQRSVDVLIVWKLDRLSRNQMDYYFIKRTLLSQSIAIHSVTEPTLEDANSISGRVYETFMALHSELDNTMRAERAVRGMQARIEAGIYPWQPPLGYRCAQHRHRGERKTVPDQPDPERFPLVERLFRTCLKEQKYNCSALTRLANRIGLTDRRGRPVTQQKVHRMMINPFYAGTIFNPWTKDTVPGRHEAMLTPAEFEEVQWLRTRKAHPFRQTRQLERDDFPLRRTALCGGCRRPLTGSWSGGRATKYPYYHCYSRACAMYGKVIRKADIEAHFYDVLRRHQPDEGRTALVVAAVRDIWAGKVGDLSVVRKRHNTQLAGLEQQLAELIGMKERSLLTDDEFLDRKKALNRDIAAAKARLSQLTIGKGERPDTSVVGTDFMRNLPDSWLNCVPAQKHRLQETVFPEGVPYIRGEGFGTAELGLIFNVLSRNSDKESELVSNLTDNWDVLVESLNILSIIIEIE